MTYFWKYLTITDIKSRDMEKILTTIAISFGILLSGSEALAQRLTLDEAIGVARLQSVEALAARSEFVSSYWAWRSGRRAGCRR